MTMEATASFIRKLFFFYLMFDGIVFALMIYQQLASNATRTWLSASGRIVSSRVSHKNNDVRYGPSPEITYTYEVNGKSHKGDVITRGGISSRGRKFSEAVVARYPKDSAVTVFYNPKKPSESCLERYSMAHAPEWKWIVAGTLILPFVALLAYLNLGR